MKLFLLPTLLLISFSTFAQNHFVGINGGVSGNDVNSAFTHSEPLLGFNVGFSYEYRVKNHLSFGADLMYNKKRFKHHLLSIPEGGVPITETGRLEFNFNYLSMPIKVGYYVGNNLSGFVNLGLIPSMALNATYYVPIMNDEETGREYTGLTSKYDLAGLIELGGNISLTERLFLIASVSYQHSFTSFAKPDYDKDIDVKHHGIILSGGVKYALKKE